MYDDSFPDLGYGDSNGTNDLEDRFRHDLYDDSNVVNGNGQRSVKQRVMTSPARQNTVREPLSNFESYPAIVHFSEWVVKEGSTQTISVTNRSKRSLRFQIYPPTSQEFVTSYDKIGSLAPGMSQIITVRFTALEYKYYYDCLRIQGEDSSLLIPLHGYHIANKVYFPKLLLFGSIPLCEPATQKISLSCSIPVNFSFEIKMIQPHPYYTVQPTRGIIPANGSIDVRIVFNPVTLGTCAIKIQLTIGQFGFVPVECEVSARAVSGVIESKELLRAEKRLLQYVLNSGNNVNTVLGETSTFAGDLEPLEEPFSSTIKESRFSNTNLLKKGIAKSHQDDPVAMMLANTFRSVDLNSSLDSAVRGRNTLLGTKILPKNADGSYTGVRAVDGLLKATLPMLPRGPGSGIVFDAGAQWMSSQNAMNFKKKLTQSKKKGGGVGDVTRPQDSVVAGLRIPARLDTVQSVSFVLTQEAGKLKPKDLKIAIDRNRAEREVRAEEQERMREQGGGSGMDLKGILAEEQLSSSSGGDPFKKQLREMAFLADVDDVRRQEAEKEFRVSEEFSGAIPLTEGEIEEILHQREVLALRRKRSDWRDTQSRQHTLSYPPSHASVKAGASAAVLLQAVESLTPSFDSNRNDIWAKRMNTLRYFISSVTRSIVRRRAGLRLAKIQAKLTAVIGNQCESQQLNSKTVTNGATGMNGLTLNGGMSKAQRNTRKELVRAWIEDENATNRLRVGAVAASAAPTAASDGRAATEDSHFSFDQCTTVAELVCASDHEAVAKRKQSEHITSTQRFELSSTTVQRILFPKCIIEEGDALQTLKAQGIESTVQFDDRTFFQLKVRPEHTAMRYTPHKVPEIPLFFPMGKDKERRTGAPEENSLRPPADFNVTLEAFLDNLNNLPPEPAGITAMRTAAITAAALALTDIPVELEVKEGEVKEAKPPSQYAAPSWLLSAPAGDEWAASDLDFFKPRPDLRVYTTGPSVRETDADWILRPYAYSAEESLVYKEDESIRSSWLKVPGFSSANAYLLRGLESRCTPSSDIPPHGPTLSDFHMPDLDRHRSGLNCFGRDHLRSLAGEDIDLTPLQHRQAKADHLTDSESDEDEKYAAPAPSMKRVRALLSGKSMRPQSSKPPLEKPQSANKKKDKGDKGGKEMGAVAVAAAVVVPDADAIVEDDDDEEGDEKKGEQVELMRDRKTLELERSLSIARQTQASAYTDRLTELSKASQCLLQAVSVQTPFHTYDSVAFKAFGKKISHVPTFFIEPPDKK